MERWCAQRNADEVQRAFDMHRVCWGWYRTTRELLHHDDRVGLSNPVWERLDTAGVGAHLAAGTPIRAAREERTASTPAPLIGQHTDEILHDVLNLDSSQVGRLHDAGIVAGADRDPTMHVRT